MNLLLSTTPPQKSGTGQAGATLKGGVLPEGFALLAGAKAPAEVPALPVDTATAETAVASSVSLEVSGAPAVPGAAAVATLETALSEDHSFGQSLQAAVTQPAVANDLLLQQQAFLTGRTQAEPVHQLTMQTNGPPTITTPMVSVVQPDASMAHAGDQGSQAPFAQPVVGGQLSGQQALKGDTPVQDLKAQAGSPAPIAEAPVPVGKSAATPILGAASVQPPNQQMVVEQQIGSVTTSPRNALANQVQGAAVASTQAEQHVVEPGKQSVPKPENSNQAPSVLNNREMVPSQFTTAKAIGDHDTAKPVTAVKPVELGASQTPIVPAASPTPNSANTNVTTTPFVDTTPLPDVARQAAMVPQTHGLPQVANVDRKLPSDQARIATVTAVTDTGKPANIMAEGSVGPAEQGPRTTQQPAAMVDIFAKPAALAGLEKPVTSMGEPLDVLDRAQTAPVSVLATDNASAAAKTVLAQDATPKIAPKPFTEALMAQVKSVEVREGQTTVNLVPRGLGSIEVEIISEKDVASRVVVRVENPAVLQSLRDDRNLLAQAIGVSDSSIFDFQEQSAGDQSDPQHNQNGQNGDPLGDTITTQTQRQHLDVVHEGQLDILTKEDQKMLTSPALLESVSAANQSTSNTSLSQLGDDYNKFLTLLTAQISNQDPLAPVDSTQFVAQLAQLSQVEQAVQTNSQLETLTNQIAGLMNLGGTDLLGREVSVSSNVLELENGSINSNYTVGVGAIEVSARITDPLGRIVRTMTGLSPNPGQETPLDWDGTDDQGNPMLDGKYTVEIVALDSSGAQLPFEVSRDAVVEQVLFQEGEILFGLSGGEIVSSVTVRSAS
jgi:flagellar basal-body rod modification protein FlgD